MLEQGALLALFGSLGGAIGAIITYLRTLRRDAVDISQLESNLRASLMKEIKECQDGHRDTQATLQKTIAELAVVKGENVLLKARLDAMDILSAAATLAATTLNTATVAANQVMATQAARAEHLKTLEDGL